MPLSGSDLPQTPADRTDPVAADFVRLIADLDDGVIFLDRAWRITFANQIARRISRISAEDLNGPTHWELYPATVGTTQETIYRRSMEERISLHLEFHYPPFDIWVQLRTLPIPSGIAVVYSDITKLKASEANRDKTARQLEQVFEATTDAIVLLDRDFVMQFLNRRAKEILAPSAPIVGKSLWTTFPATADPDRPFVKGYHRTMYERLPSNFEAYYPEPLNCWFEVEALPAEDGIIVFFRDITAQRAAAEELLRKQREAERQAAEIETVYRTAPIGLALFDLDDFHYLRLNDRQAAFFGLKPEDVVGRTLTEMAPIPGLRELFEQVREGTPVVNYLLEGELISNPGEHRYWTVNYSPVRGVDGTVQAISAASLEITSQKKAEKALLQSEKLAAVGRLASSISHEINNPLESVTNLLYLVAQSGDLSPDVRTYVDLAQAEIARVTQIAIQTLRFHRQTASPTWVTGQQLLEPILNLYRGRLLNCNVHLETRWSSTTPFYCLENEIRQVLSNLIANAIDAMRMGGRLLLRSHDCCSGDSVRGVMLVVADDGHGMSTATRQRIFEPFFTTKELNGTGLGLWISAEIVQRHKGRIRVRSSQDPQRHGTVFGLFLPRE
jgi:PAS domain S-box-containing protein